MFLHVEKDCHECDSSETLKTLFVIRDGCGQLLERIVPELVERRECEERERAAAERLALIQAAAFEAQAGLGRRAHLSMLQHLHVSQLRYHVLHRNNHYGPRG